MHAQRSDSVYVDYVHQITRAVVKEAKKELGLLCYATGGSMPDDVVEVEVKFICYRQVTIEEARELEVKAVEILRKNINEHEKIRPFLREFPFTAKGAKVMISFRTNTNDHQTKGVALVMNVRNSLFYDAKDPLTNKLYDLFEEPYEDALKIVQNQGGSPGKSL